MKQTAFWRGKKGEYIPIFKIFSTYICWIYKMKRLEVSGAVRPLYGSLGFKGLNICNVTPNRHKLLMGECRKIREKRIFFCKYCDNQRGLKTRVHYANCSIKRQSHFVHWIQGIASPVVIRADGTANSTVPSEESALLQLTALNRKYLLLTAGRCRVGKDISLFVTYTELLHHLQFIQHATKTHYNTYIQINTRCKQICVECGKDWFWLLVNLQQTTQQSNFCVCNIRPQLC